MEENVFLAALEIKRAKEIQRQAYDDVEEDNGDLGYPNKDNHEPRPAGNLVQNAGINSSDDVGLHGEEELKRTSGGFDTARRQVLDKLNWSAFERRIFDESSANESEEETPGRSHPATRRPILHKYGSGFDRELEQGKEAQNTKFKSGLSSGARKGDNYDGTNGIVNGETANFDIKPVHAGRQEPTNPNAGVKRNGNSHLRNRE